MNLQAFCWWKCHSEMLPSLKLACRTWQEAETQKGKDGLPTITFPALLLLVSVRVTLEESKIPWLDKNLQKISLILLCGLVFVMGANTKAGKHVKNPQLESIRFISFLGGGNFFSADELFRKSVVLAVKPSSKRTCPLKYPHVQ